MKIINESLFGYETPYITKHCMQRYTQRFLGIEKTYSVAFCKTNRNRIIKEIFSKFNELKEIEVSEERKNKIKERYGSSNIRFLSYREKLLFIVQREVNKNIWIVKTCYTK